MNTLRWTLAALIATALAALVYVTTAFVIRTAWHALTGEHMGGWALVVAAAFITVLYTPFPSSTYRPATDRENQRYTGLLAAGAITNTSTERNQREK